MPCEDAIRLTFVTIVTFTVFITPYWLLSVRPITRWAGEAREARSPHAIMRGTSPIAVTGKMVHGYAWVAAFIVGVIAVSTGLLGYLWVSGIAAYGAFWIAMMHIADAGLNAPRFRNPMRLIGLAYLPLVVAFGLAFATYCGWYRLSVMGFQAICIPSEAMFFYVALRPILEG